MKKIGLVVKPNEEARNKADELEKWLISKNIEVFRKENKVPESIVLEDLSSEEDIDRAPSDLFCVFVLGGDGTFLSASRWLGKKSIPILGIKFGNVGFLAETEVEDLYNSVESVLNNNFSIEKRMRLKSQIIRDGKEFVCSTVLNDIVISKVALARLANIKTSINDQYLTTFKGDGLIISTPTGSTAYSLAAGGPILHPLVPGIITTPICPFTLTNRPLIVPDSVTIKIEFDEEATDIIITFDGQEGMEIKKGDTIIIKKSKYYLNLIKLPEQNYINTMKTKLGWSGRHLKS